jgi:glycosyltransferase involved in cell wall biosynthesis
VIDLPNGLMPSDWEPPDAEPPPLPRAASHGFILAMGRAEDHKGFDDLIDAVVLLREQGIAVPHLLLIAATDDRQLNPYQQHLAGRLAALHLEATLWTRFSHGHRQLLRHPLLRAVVIPSRVEPFGRIPLEAYAAGAAPLVSTTAGGLADLVLDGTTGFTCPPNDPHRLSAGLHRALTLSAPDVERMRVAARTFARRRFDYRRTVTGLVKTAAPWLLTDCSRR